MSTRPLGYEEILAEVKEFAVRLTASLPDRIQISALTFKSKLPFKALAIRELLIHRVSELASSAVENFEIGRVVSGIALTRAVMETGALIFELHRRVTQFLVDKNVEQFDSFLMISLMGSHNNADLPLAMNVLTVINRRHSVRSHSPELGWHNGIVWRNRQRKVRAEARLVGSGDRLPCRR